MEIGALWLKKSTDGKPYFSGTIEFPGTSIPVVIFKNTEKKEEKHPDYKIIWSKPKQGGGTPAAGVQNTFNDDGVPF